MKKIVALTFLSIFTIFPNTLFGFFDEMGELDMYKKVDKGMYELQNTYTTRELRGGNVNQSIVEQLKEQDMFYNYRNCFDVEFTPEEIKQIAQDDQANSLLMEKIKTCADEDVIDIPTFLSYQKLIQKYYVTSIQTAQSKTQTLQQIASIGLYADGVEENSPFDILIDLEKINEVIFEQDLKYEGYNNFDIDSYIDDETSGVPLGWNRYGYDSQNQNSPYVSNTKKQVKPLLPSPISEDACFIDNSGLSQESFDALLKTGTNSGSTQSGSQNNSGNTSGGSQKGQEYLDYVGDYSAVNDNALWPCNTYFCITVDFIKYRQNLLGGGKTLAIESLIKRSNEHIGKFTYTSLVPSTMTTNNFELGFRNLNLPDLFHVGVQITTKPVPFLNLDKSDSRKARDETEFASKNLLFTYFKNLGMDYDRVNDLSIFRAEEEELKTLGMSSELPISYSVENTNDFTNYRNQFGYENTLLENTITQKSALDDLGEFQAQFTELETFTKTIMEYTQNLAALAQKVSELDKK